MSPIRGSDKLLSAKMVVTKNDVHNQARPGGILQFQVPPEELRRILEKEDILKGLPKEGITGVQLTIFFSRNSPMLQFPASGDELIEQGFMLDFYKLPKFTKAERKALGLKPATEVDEDLNTSQESETET